MAGGGLRADLRKDSTAVESGSGCASLEWMSGTRAGAGENRTMQYALLIYEDESVYGDGQVKVIEGVLGGHIAFGQANGHAIRGGQGLQNTSSATTLRTGGGKQSLHDGPFAETREQLGGFYVVEAADLDEAIAMARQIPLAKDGAIEVRPVMPTSDGAAS